MAVTVVAILSSGWALWLMSDRPALALALGLLCLAVLLIGLSRRQSVPVGFMQVDDLGRVFWRPGHGDDPAHSAESAAVGLAGKGDLMVPAKWHRAERSVWIRLEVDSLKSSPANKSLPLDLRIQASGTSADDWAALQRWLVWMERGKSH
jgi:hypothetical protein